MPDLPPVAPPPPAAASAPVSGAAGRDAARRRLSVFLGLSAVGLAAVLGRLAWLQVEEGDRLRAVRDRNTQGVLTQERPRLKIVFRGGQLAAQTVRRDSLFVEPPRVVDAAETAARLAGALRCAPGPLLALLDPRVAGDPERVCRFRWVRRLMDPEDAARVRTLGLPGLGFREEFIRRYPLGPSAAHVLGAVGVDGQGLAGVELAYDPLLRGARDARPVLQDARRRPFALEKSLPVIPTEGYALALTLDAGIQRIVEEELDRVVAEHRPAWTAGLAVNPFTGEVLGIACRPAFDPNTYGQADAAARRARFFTDTYEPGSTMKPFFLAALLDEGLVRLEDTIDCEGGSWSAGGRRITDHHPYGRLTVQEVIAKSSNIGAVKLGLTLEEKRGSARLRQALLAAGFGRETGVGVPGESAGRLTPPAQWSRYTSTSVPIGYEVGVTPAQMARAYSAFANGGLLVNLSLVRGVVDAAGRTVWEPGAEPPARAYRPETAALVRKALRAAVETGTAKLAAAPGYAVAGKTGTTQRYNPQTRRYDGGYIGSFAGFAPAEDARLCVLVVVDGPTGKDYYGGKIAAPAVGRILARSLQLLEVPPSETKITMDSAR